MEVKKSDSIQSSSYLTQPEGSQPEASGKQASKGISKAQDSFEKTPKGTLLIDLSPEEIQRARKGQKAPAAEPQKAKDSEISKRAKEVLEFVGNAAQEALMQWAGKGSPIPLPPTPPDAETGKNVHKGVTVLKEMNNRNYEQLVDQKGGNSENK